MGDMTVAPTTGVGVVPQFDAVTRVRISCTTCGTAASGREPYCAHCGARVVLASRQGPASVAATRTLQLALLVVLINILVGGMSFGVVYLVADAANLNEAALGLEGMRLLLVGALVWLTIRRGILGLRETRDGALRRRGWAIAGIVISSIWGLLVTLSFAATTALYFAMR